MNRERVERQRDGERQRKQRVGYGDAERNERWREREFDAHSS